MYYVQRKIAQRFSPPNQHLLPMPTYVPIKYLQRPVNTILLTIASLFKRHVRYSSI